MGALGDMGAHLIDQPFWALDLGAPQTIVSETPDYDPKTQGDAYPKGEKITFQFGPKGKRGPITMRALRWRRRGPGPGSGSR